MPPPEIRFTPSTDVACLVHALLDRYERRIGSLSSDLPEARRKRLIRCSLEELDLPGYFSQLDPEPRVIANGQFQELGQLGLLSLEWLRGEKGHLLQAVAMPLEGAEPLYRFVGRIPLSAHRTRLESLLLGERFRFMNKDWRELALRQALERVKAGKSVAPFKLEDPIFNEDLLTILSALPELVEETPFRAFSVRIFNDSKRLDDLKPALVRLARQANPEWKGLLPEEILRELNLVANPDYLYLSGPWELVDAHGQALSSGGFTPAVGLPAAQAAHLQRVSVPARAILCIENPTTFYEFIRSAGDLNRYAVLCLWGNPSPACRHLLRLSPASVPLYLWADLDYGGFNILAQLRKQVDPRAAPYCMDIETLDTYARFARPLTQVDQRNLERLSIRPELKDVRTVIQHLLQRGLKLEQEAVEIRAQGSKTRPIN